MDTVLGGFGLLVFALFLIMGATSVLWHRMIVNGQWTRMQQHRESYSVILSVVVLGFVIALIIASVSSIRPGQAGGVMIEGMLNAASLVSTSGVESRPGVFSLLSLPLVLFIILIGGSAFSTSGGFKHYRIGAMAVQSWSELDRLVYPSAVRPTRFGTQRFDLQLMKAIWSFFVIAIIVIAAGTVVVATSNAPFEAALTATISAFSTAGPVYNSGWAEPGAAAWPTYSAFSDTSKLALMAVMILGRLEVLAVIGIFSTRYWRNR